MATGAFDLNQRPRELRHRVVLPARVRIGSCWRDACILNVSSRGLMIRTRSGIDEGRVIEIRRGDHAMFARVVWRDGSKAGLQADERLPVEEMMSVAQTAVQAAVTDSLTMSRRRKQQPTHQDSRQRARFIEFVSTLAIAAGLSAAVLSMAYQAFAKPLAIIGAALSG